MAKTKAIEQELRYTVATAGKILYRLGLTEYMGHASARVPGTDRILIKPRHSETIHGMGEVGPEKVVVIDLDGNLLEGDDGPPAGSARARAAARPRRFRVATGLAVAWLLSVATPGPAAAPILGPAGRQKRLRRKE